MAEGGEETDSVAELLARSFSSKRKDSSDISNEGIINSMTASEQTILLGMDYGCYFQLTDMVLGATKGL